MPTLNAAQLRPSIFPPAKVDHAKSLHGIGLISIHFYPCVIPDFARPWWNDFTGRDIMAQAQDKARRSGYPHRVQQEELYSAEGKSDYVNIDGGVCVTGSLDILGEIPRGRMGIQLSDFLRINPDCTYIEIASNVNGGQNFRKMLSRRELSERRIILEPMLDVEPRRGTIKIVIMPSPAQSCHPRNIVFELTYSKETADRPPRPSRGPVSRYSLMSSESQLAKERGLDEVDDRSSHSARNEQPAKREDPLGNQQSAAASVSATEANSSTSSPPSPPDVRMTLFPTWFASPPADAPKKSSLPPPEAPSEEEVRAAAWRLNLMRQLREQGRDPRGKAETAWMGVIVGSNAEINGTGIV